jgi:hypothetical protein
MAELAACNAGTKVEVADSDRVVLDVVREVVIALGHGSDEDAYAFILVQALDVVRHPYDRRLEAQGDLSAVRREMVGDGILDHVNEFLLGCGGADLVSVEKLDHQTCEALESTRDSHSRADFDEDVLSRLDVDLEFAGFIDRGVKEGEKTLQGMSDVSVNVIGPVILDE